MGLFFNLTISGLVSYLKSIFNLNFNISAIIFLTLNLSEGREIGH